MVSTGYGEGEKAIAAGEKSSTGVLATDKTSVGVCEKTSRAGDITARAGEKTSLAGDITATVSGNLSENGLSDKLSIILEATADLNTMLSDTEALYSSLLERLSRAVPFYSGSIQVLDGDSFRIIAFRGPMDPAVVMGLRFPIDPLYPNFRVASAREPIHFADIREEYPHFLTRQAEFCSGHIRSWLGVPMIVSGSIIGMIALDRNIVDRFLPEDLRIVQGFANHAAVAIQNSITYRKLEEALASKDQLMRELHHRVKNNLVLVASLIALHSSRIVGEDNRDILEELRLRIDSVAAAHARLCDQKDPSIGVDLAAYLCDIIADFESSFLGPASGMAIVKDLATLFVEMSTAVPLGLILNELLTNAVKYAFRGKSVGKVSVRLRGEGSRATLGVEDDGIGIAVISEKSPEGFGTQLVRSLALQVGGGAELESRPGRTAWTVFFPVS